MHLLGTGGKRFLLSIVTLLLVATSVSTASAQAGGPPPDSPGFTQGQAALDRIADRLPEVAQNYGMTAAQLRSMLRNDPTVAVDDDLEIAYFDMLAPGEATAVTAAVTQDAPPVTGAEFQLSSRPGAAKTIYLDFDGHITEGTTWNNAYGVTSIVSPPYDTDQSPDTWSATELSVIARSFEVVAEDFAPWDINVTTIDPGAEALRRSGSGDTQWGARVVITADTFANCGCGGHAYLGSFDDSSDEPTFVYNSSFNGVSEAISHEVGHMLLLTHDGTSTSSYYTGHDGEGSTGWAPIMGAAYYQPVAQWSQQEYLNANNNTSSANSGNGRDDLAVISSLTNGNGFGLRPDDHGSTLATATPLVGSDPTVSGVIGTSADVDAFSFSTGGGEVTFEANPDEQSANLDIALTLRNSSGDAIATSNPTGTLAAQLTTTVSAGSYTIEVDGVGVGDPLASTPTGYTDYGSIGQFTMVGTLGSVNPPDGTPPAAPTGLSATVTEPDVLLAWTANTEADLAGYTVLRSENGGPSIELGPVGANVTTFIDTPGAGDFSYTIVATDSSGNRSSPSNSAVASIAVSLSSVANGELAVSGSVGGTFTQTWEADGSVQTITEAESGGRPNRRHDLLEHQWAIPATGGAQTLTVVAQVIDGGDRDNGVNVEWSANQTSWAPLGTITPGAVRTLNFPLGANTGTIWVRVIDTNRSAGERSFDRVEVDLLRVDGEELGDATETLLSSLTLGKQSAGKGQSRGTASVTVQNDLGQPVAGAIVTVQFSGSINEVVTVTTGPAGTATAVTTATAKRPSLTACVSSITATPLPYNGGTVCTAN